MFASTSRFTCVSTALFHLLLGAIAQTALAQSPPVAHTSAQYAEDYAAAFTFVESNYAYFDRKKTDWTAVRTRFAPRAQAAVSDAAFIGVLEASLEQLYDSHAHLGVNTPSSPRLVPSGTDLWAEHRDGRAIITEVRAGSNAERAGVRADMEVASIDGRKVRDAVVSRRPVTLRELDGAADDWALRAELAGYHDRPLRLELRDGKGMKTVKFAPGTPDSDTKLEAHLLQTNVGYIRIHDSLGENELIAAWDAALATMRDTRGLIIDLRDTPSGGNTTVARGLMSRLIADTRAYQRHELPAEEREFGVKRVWVEYVAARGPFTYEKPVVVLVGHWTGSMGEGIAIGLDGMQRATIVGTTMAGLLGANYEETLPHTQIRVRVPAERLFHVNGTPREDFVPKSLAQIKAGTDPLLQAAVSILK